MIFAARQMSYSRLDSSPVASGWSRSCSMMNRSIVMTSVGPNTLTIAFECDRALAVGPMHLDAVRDQPGHDLRRRMSVGVVRPDADHGDLGFGFIEPGLRG